MIAPTKCRSSVFQHRFLISLMCGFPKYICDLDDFSHIQVHLQIQPLAIQNPSLLKPLNVSDNASPGSEMQNGDPIKVGSIMDHTKVGNLILLSS